MFTNLDSGRSRPARTMFPDVEISGAVYVVIGEDETGNPVLQTWKGSTLFDLDTARYLKDFLGSHMNLDLHIFPATVAITGSEIE